MKKLIISILVVIASTSFQPNLEGNNSNTFTHDLLESNKSILTHDFNNTTFINLFDFYSTGDKKIRVRVKNEDPTIANATIKLVSPNGINQSGPHYIEEGTDYEFYVPDDTWYVSIISSSENAEVVYWYE